MTSPRPRRLVAACLLALLAAPAIEARPTQGGDPPDGLPGRLAAPTRDQIEAVLRKLDRDPVTPDLVDRSDALYRPHCAPSRRFEDLLENLAKPDLVGRIDEIAKRETGQRADARALLYRLAAITPDLDPQALLAAFRDDRERELGPRKTLRGRVTDASTRRPIAGAVIQVFSGMLARTDAKGAYKLVFRKTGGGGTLPVFVEAPGYALTGCGFEWDELGDEESVDFRLPREASFRGRVIDPAGKPIAGADLKLNVPPETVVREVPENGRRLPMVVTLAARTDDRGEYALRGVPPEVEGVAQAQSLVVSHKTHQPRQKIYRQTELLGPGWEITLEPGHVLTGRVVDEAGRPVPRAWVRVVGGNVFGGPHDTTDAEGRFRFEELPVAEMDVIAMPPDLLTTTVTTRTRDDGPTNVTVVAKAGAFLTGTVIGQDDKPAKGATVGWVQTIDKDGNVVPDRTYVNRSTRADDRGKFRLGPLEKGRYRVMALVDPPRALGRAEGEAGGEPIEIRLKPDR